MIFSEPRFVLFFFIAWLVSWSLAANRTRKFWLLGCSYIFYGAWDWRFLSLIMLSTFFDFWVGLNLERTTKPTQRRHWIIASVMVNLGILAIFKYFNFFIDTALQLSHFLGLPAYNRTLDVILPVGISFFTFQSMSYTIDVYRNNLRATRNLLDFALFVAFFPQLVAGPIVRAVDFLPQLTRLPVWSQVNVRGSILLFLIGYFKKVCVSDNISNIVDAVYAAPEYYSPTSHIGATVAYAVQIYCDFSGYSDMALGTAGLLGYTLCTNFNFPYFSSNITEFWQRWHISLSTWLKDYLYISLGGNRLGRFRTYRNLLLTMLLGGLWHGAAWRFIIWGALHGIALILHRLWSESRRSSGSKRGWFQPIAIVVTFYWICITWIFFRAQDVHSASIILRSLLFLNVFEGRASDLNNLVGLLPLAGLHGLNFRYQVLEKMETLPPPLFAIVAGVAVSLLLAFSPTNSQPFIYFQF